MRKLVNWVVGSFSRTAGRFLFYFILFLILSFCIHSCEVKAATIDNYIVTANGNSQTQGGYRTLYNVNGPTGQFAYGPNSFIYFNNIQMGVPDKNPGDKFSYILGVQVCQTMSEVSLTYDGGSAHNQVNYIDSLGGYKTTSKCTVNGYSVNKVNYYFEVNGTLTSTGDTAFTDQRFVLRFGSAYNEFNITNISFSEYSQELVNQIQNSIKQNELINKQDITNSKLDGLQSEIGETNDKLDQTNQNLNKVDSSINKVDSSLNNSNVDDPSSAFNQFESYLPENGVITNLITLPISLFQKVLSSINGACAQYNLGNLMGTDLILPCINISNYIGSTLWNVIDVLFSGLFVLVISKKMIKVFNNFTSMEEGDVLD